MKLYQTEIRVYASLYILAESRAEAQAKADALTDGKHALQFSDRRQEIGDGIFMTGENFSKDMPELSLSPVMTIADMTTRPVVYEAEDFDPEDELCGECDGTGTIVGGLGGDGEDEECPVCDGSGSISD